MLTGEAIVSVNDLVAVRLAASLTSTVNVWLSAPVGVPLISPLELLSESPAGSVPVVTIQFEYGAVPPVAASVCEYATPTVPSLRGEAVVILTGEAIVSVNDLVAVRLAASLTSTVNVTTASPL